MWSASWGGRLVTVLLCLVAGALAGGIAGWYSAHVSVEPQILGLERIFRDQLTTVRPPTASSSVEVVSVAPPPPRPDYPEIFLNRSVSPVLTLVRRATGAKGESGLVTPERIVGSVISLTSDGWFVTSVTTLGNLRLNELSVSWRGRTYPVVQGVRDTATGAVFLKASVTGLPVTNLVRANEVLPGTPVWVESLSGHIRPSMITSVRARATSTIAVVSEVATRQFLLADLVPEANGGAVWNSRGDLLGVLARERVTDLPRVLPANNIIQALQSLLNEREIRHASLGVRAVDLSQAVFDDDRRPGILGAWITSLSPTLSTFLPQSPATTALKENDVILRIERDLLDGGADLGERLLDYRPGSAVMIYGTRNGVPFQAPVTLGTVVTSEVLK